MTRSRQKFKNEVAAPIWILQTDNIWQAYTKAHPKQARKMVDESLHWGDAERHAFMQGFLSGMVGWANRPEEKL